MTDSTNKPNVVFWIVGIITLVWNAMGVKAYIDQAYNTEAHQTQMATQPAELIEVVSNMPTWYTAIFAIAVFAGALGCVFMLLRKKMANLFFKISLLAVLVQTIYNGFISGALEYFEAFDYSMFFSIPIVAIFLVLYSKKSTEKGWLA